MGCGRDGITALSRPLIVRPPTLREEVGQVAELLASAHREGHAWADMAILCRHHSEGHVRRNSSSVFDTAHDSSKVMTLHASKGLEFPVVAPVGVGNMPAHGEDERDEARLFYVGAHGRRTD